MSERSDTCDKELNSFEWDDVLFPLALFLATGALTYFLEVFL